MQEQEQRQREQRALQIQAQQVQQTQQVQQPEGVSQGVSAGTADRGSISEGVSQGANVFLTNSLKFTGMAARVRACANAMKFASYKLCPLCAINPDLEPAPL